jgi:hypothetical protein
MDHLYPFAHHIHLGLTDGTLQGVDLTIEVGPANFVEIDQSDGSDCRPGKGFSGQDPTPPRPTTQTCDASRRSSPSRP